MHDLHYLCFFFFFFFCFFVVFVLFCFVCFILAFCHVDIDVYIYNTCPFWIVERILMSIMYSAANSQVFTGYSLRIIIIVVVVVITIIIVVVVVVVVSFISDLWGSQEPYPRTNSFHFVYSAFFRPIPSPVWNRRWENEWNASSQTTRC